MHINYAGITRTRMGSLCYHEPRHFKLVDVWIISETCKSISIIIIIMYRNLALILSSTLPACITQGGGGGLLICTGYQEFMRVCSVLCTLEDSGVSRLVKLPGHQVDQWLKNSRFLFSSHPIQWKKSICNRHLSLGYQGTDKLCLGLCPGRPWCSYATAWGY